MEYAWTVKFAFCQTASESRSSANNSFKPSPLRGLGPAESHRAGRLNSGVRSLMGFHRPNHVPGRTRVLLALAIIVILLYATAHLVTGYVYLPTKRGGGFLLSGASTLMIVIAQLLIAAGCAAKIVDHYDTRPNEPTYQRFRRTSFKFSLVLFLFAPLAQLAVALLRIAGVHLPNFHGLASEFTFYSPSLKAYTSVLSLDKSTLLPLGGAAGILLLAGWISAKFKLGSTRIQMLLTASSLLLLSIFCMNMFMHDLLVGQTELGRRSHRTLVGAISDPAKFNAVLLTKFSLFGLVFTFSLLALLGGLIGKSDKTYWQGFWKSFHDK